MKLDKLGFNNLKDLIDVSCEIPSIHQHFIPFYYVMDGGVYYIKSKNGIILLTNLMCWTRVLIIGDIDFEQLSNIIGDENVFICWKSKENKPLEYFKNGNEYMLDFILNISDKDLHKFDIKNSVKRKMENVKICYDEQIDVNTYMSLYKKWEPNDVRPKTIDKHLSYIKNPKIHNICYYYDDVLFGVQTYIELGLHKYLLTDVKDTKDFKDYTSVCISNLLHDGNFHYLGCGKNDYDLALHKNRICKGNFDFYDNISIFNKHNSRKANKKDILKFVESNIDKDVTINIPDVVKKKVLPLF